MKSAARFFTEERLLLIGTTIVLLLLFARLYINLSPGLNQTEQDYTQGRAINLRAGINTDSLRHILSNGNYYTDEKDLDLVTDSLVSEIEKTGTLDNLGAINLRAFAITVPTTVTPLIGGEDFLGRVAASRVRLGFDSTLYQQELTHPARLPDTQRVGAGPYSISGRVIDADSGKAIEGVRVQLQSHSGSSLGKENTDSYRYTRTDTTGRFSFTGLTSGSGYSVLPLKPGFEFGSRQGKADLDDSLTVTFKARSHKIRLIGALTFEQLKADKALTVRTPAEFKNSFLIIIAILLASFWGIHLFWSIRGFRHDEFLLPVLMLLVGISILTLLSIQDPVQDAMHAYQMVVRGAIGLIGMAAISQINIGKFYTNWKYDPLYTILSRLRLRKKTFFNLQGWTWLIAAIGLALLTLRFGDGPEGSGVKVNLTLPGLKFQPSEITKYLLLFFFAGFFASNEKRIRELSDARWRVRVSFWMLVGTGCLLALYLVGLGDMGPALVVCFTFLIFYSIARGNLGTTLVVGVSYGFLLYFLSPVSATVITIVTAIGYMIWQGTFKANKWYGWLALSGEAPIIMALIIATFTFGDKVSFVGDRLERLTDRKTMWLSKWDNDVYGGDHLAHSYWTLSSGGFSGQGLGKGFANTMPAAHTDMILPSIGEELGWLGLVAILLLFAILIHRTLLIARRAGQPFSFYLCAGIGIATGVQFLLIASGSIGLLPLTGVAVPLLSFGSTALLINLLAIGLVFGISNRPGEDVQKEYIEKHYNPVLLAGILGFGSGIVLLIVALFYVQIVAGKDYIVKSARVVNRTRLPIYSPNPRIDILSRRLAAGNIYDRNGYILATSNPKIIEKNAEFLVKAGLDLIKLEKIAQKKLRRYYPFEEQLFFWVGDYNTRLLWGSENGYFAENRYLSTLRGFNNRPQKSIFTADRYQADRFSKPVKKDSIPMILYDYSEMADILRAGLDSKQAEALKAKNRDIKLSLDAALQVDLQKAVAEFQKTVADPVFRNKRISVVVLDAASGDVLASTVNPLPDLQNRDLMVMPEEEKTKLNYVITDRDLGMTYATAPGSTAKILTASAAFNKLVFRADTTYKDIFFEEIIRDKKPEQEPFGVPINMRKAIVESSNIYFIRLANDNTLDNEMAELYLATGMNIDLVGGYSYNFSLNDTQRRRILRRWRDSSFVINRNFYHSKPTHTQARYNSEFSGLAWGQGKLTSTPAALARMAGAIANRGLLQPSRYVLKEGDTAKSIGKGIPILKKADYAGELTSFMIEQSNPMDGRRPKIDSSRVAGKTGTPNRDIKKLRRSDGWYVFFAPTRNGRSHTVVCVRIELGEASGNAVKLANEIIAPILRRRGYLGSF